jgi:hypothetical protein
MQRVMRLGLCVLAAAAVGVGDAAAAGAAEPAFYECVKLKGGKFKGGCKEESAKGSAELREGIGKGKAIKGKGTTLSPFVPHFAGGEITCKKTKLVATPATATKLEGFQITETGCVGGAGLKRCTSAGQKPGTIVSERLSGTFGYIDAAEHRVGLDLKGEPASEIEFPEGPVIESFDCEGLTYEINGSAIAEVTPLNTLTNEYTLTFARDGEGFQRVKSLEGRPEDVPLVALNGSGPFPGALAGTLIYKGEKLELKG